MPKKYIQMKAKLVLKNTLAALDQELTRVNPSNTRLEFLVRKINIIAELTH